jgi:hypothetical protein
MKFMENKLFYAGLLFMGFGVLLGALLGRWSAFLFGLALFTVDTLDRGGLLEPITKTSKVFFVSCGKLVADAVSGKKGDFAKSFSRICLYIFFAVVFIAIARIWQNGLTLLLGVIGMAMLFIPPVALITHFVAKTGWAHMEEKKEKEKKAS